MQNYLLNQMMLACLSWLRNIFRNIISDYSRKEAGKGSIVRELSGIINIENVDYKEEYTKYLEEKYE